MRRDHWIEIFRSTGVQTGQSRLHNVKENVMRARWSALAWQNTDIPSRILALSDWLTEP
jgi:hypothetical protein